MKKFILITAALTMLWTGTTFAQRIEKPDKTYTAEEINERLAEGESVPFIDILYAEQNELPDLMAEPDSITSTSFYDQLTVEEKKYYDFIDKNIDTTLDGISNLTYETDDFEANVDMDTYKDSQLGPAYITELFTEIIGEDPVMFVRRAFFTYLGLDHPEKFWIDTSHGVNINLNSMATTKSISFSVIISPRENLKYYPECYTSEAQVRSDIAAMDKKVDEIVSAIPENASDFYKVKYFTEWLTEHNSYNNTAFESKEYTDKNLYYAYIAPSALLYGSEDSTNARNPVCEGYSEAFKILCDKAGVETMCLTSENHKWNVVKLNGKFYNSDPTWCDPVSSDDNIPGIIKYSFMLLGSRMTNKIDDSGEHDISMNGNLIAPAISENMYIQDMGFPIYEGLEYGEGKYSFPFFTYKYLDIDDSSDLNTDDIRELLYQAAEIKPQTSQDFNGNDVIDLSDAIKYMKLMFI